MLLEYPKYGEVGLELKSYELKLSCGRGSLSTINNSTLTMASSGCSYLRMPLVVLLAEKVMEL